MSAVEARDLDRWKVEPLERRHRGIDERVAIALPGASRRLRAFVLRRPAGTSYHPDAEFFSPSWRGGAGLGFDPLYRGPDAVERFVREWKSGFRRFVYEPLEIADAGGDSFAVRLGIIGKLRDADAEVREEYGDWDAALAALTAA